MLARHSTAIGARVVFGHTLALGTFDSLRPPLRGKVKQTSLFVGKVFAKLSNRVFFHDLLNFLHLAKVKSSPFMHSIAVTVCHKFGKFYLHKASRKPLYADALASDKLRLRRACDNSHPLVFQFHHSFDVGNGAQGRSATPQSGLSMLNTVKTFAHFAAFGTLNCNVIPHDWHTISALVLPSGTAPRMF
jgi:hypothetical protein